MEADGCAYDCPLSKVKPKLDELWCDFDTSGRKADISRDDGGEGSSGEGTSGATAACVGAGASAHVVCAAAVAALLWP